jgi:hypothetical protein
MQLRIAFYYHANSYSCLQRCLFGHSSSGDPLQNQTTLGRLINLSRGEGNKEESIHVLWHVVHKTKSSFRPPFLAQADFEETQVLDVGLRWELGLSLLILCSISRGLLDHHSSGGAESGGQGRKR